jgi:hypothetical protein
VVLVALAYQVAVISLCGAKTQCVKSPQVYVVRGVATGRAEATLHNGIGGFAEFRLKLFGKS